LLQEQNADRPRYPGRVAGVCHQAGYTRERRNKMSEKNTPTSAAEMAAALGCERPGCPCGRSDGKGWLTHCPAHDDERPSLSVADGDGRVLVHCFAGCPQDAVIDALRRRGLWPGGGASDERPANYKQEPILRWYDYRNADGSVAFAVGRTESKQFPAIRPDEAGEWAWGLADRRRILYRLPELLGADPKRAIFVVEGEKDADRLAGLGVLATTSSGGAGKWHLVDQEPLRGRHVVVIPDNDEAGRRHAAEVAGSLREVARRVTLLEPLQGTGPGGDVSEFLDRGGTLDLLKVITNEAVGQSTPGVGEQSTVSAKRSGDDGPVLITIADVKPESVSWLWPGYLPLGKVTVLAGDPGVGKSWLTLAIGAAVTKGVDLGEVIGRGKGGGGPEPVEGEPAGVLLLTAEDGLADTVRPRLDGMKADLARVEVLQAIRKGGREHHPSLAEDMDAIEKALDGKNVKLIVIDPLSAYLGDVDTYRDAEMRAVLTPLAKMAERRRVAVVGIIHLSKGSRDRPIYRVLGSIAIAAAARVVLVVGRNPNDEEERVLAPMKNNIAREMPSIGFEITDGQFLWRGETDVRADKLFVASAGFGVPSALDEAKDFLSQELAGGPVRQQEIHRKATEAGIAPPTLKRAKAALGVESHHRQEGKGGENGYWEWSLPGAQEDHSPIDDPLIPLSQDELGVSPVHDETDPSTGSQEDQDQHSGPAIPLDGVRNGPQEAGAGKPRKGGVCRRCGGPNVEWGFPYCRPCWRKAVDNMHRDGG